LKMKLHAESLMNTEHGAPLNNCLFCVVLFVRIF
jgi:hypothetical protein